MKPFVFASFSLLVCLSAHSSEPIKTTSQAVFSSDDSAKQPSTVKVIRSTSLVSDAVFADHEASGPEGSGYGFHALDHGNGTGGGGAIGGATERSATADAVVGNRRGAGPGNGMIGSRWENGDGSGVKGVMRGTGTGSGVMGYKSGTGIGDAVYGKNESANGSGVYGHRLIGAGHGFGVLGHAEGVNGREDASIAAIKTAADNGYALLIDSRSVDSALRVNAGTNAALAVDSVTDWKNGGPVSNRFERQNAGGAVAEFVSSGSGPRAVPLNGQLITVAPTAISSGEPTVSGQSIVLSENVQGSTEARASNVISYTSGGDTSYGVKSQALGNNAVNYGIYGNAQGAKTNWAGFFVGDVQVGRLLIPADKKHQDIHGEADYQKSLEAVMAGKVYISDRYVTWKETGPDGVVTEKRQKISSDELNVLAEDVQQKTPGAVKVDDDGSLSVSDREQLYQLKAAFIQLTRKLKEQGVKLDP